jgi:hypothetical protein
MPAKAASESLGAQMSMLRKRHEKICDNPECGTTFEGLAVARFCSDECRFRSAWLDSKAEEAAMEKAAAQKKRARRVVSRARL